MRALRLAECLLTSSGYYCRYNCDHYYHIQYEYNHDNEYINSSWYK